MSNEYEDFLTNNEQVSTGKHGQTTAFKIHDFAQTPLGMFIINRLVKDRDTKILITSQGNTTGTGKTTLAIQLARVINKIANKVLDNNNEFNAESNGFVNAYEWISMYQEAEGGEVFITDELEYMVDNRRSMSAQNVAISHAYQMLRFKNCTTIATAPGPHTLDLRVFQNNDIWLLVTQQGRAIPFKISVGDLSGDMYTTRFKYNGYGLTLLWKDLPEGDEDYENLTGKKRKEALNIAKKQEQENPKEVKRQTKINATVNLLKMKQEGNIDITQADIADIVDMSQQWVYKVKRDKLS